MVFSSSHHILPLVDRFIITAKWNSAIRQAVNQGQAHNALRLFRQMKVIQAQPNNFTFPFIAKACANQSNPKLSQMIHAHVKKTPYHADVYVQTALVDMYVKCERLECARKVFDEMSDRDLVSWNAMVVGYAQVGLFDRVLSLFNEMRVGGVMPDAVTVMGLTQLVSGTRDGRLLRGVHCFGVKSGFETDVVVANTWISGYARCGDLRSSEMVFKGIELGSLTVVSWNALIAGCACVEESVKALRVYRRMLCDGYRPDLSTLLNLLASFVQQCSLYYGMIVHAHGVKLGCDSGITLLNTLVSMYSKCGHIGSARYIFDSMDEKTCVTWTSMIGGYSGIGDLDEALSLFHSMNAAGKKPDLVTIIHILSACGKVGALEVGKWMDNYTVSDDLKCNVVMCNALLDMYVKCGSLRDAQKLFLTMNPKNIVSWTTLIAGFALNGEFQAALDHFNQMLKLGLKPNHVTFLAVLQACAHAGFLEKGWEIFNMMIKVYKINPGLDHYACMTDLLGRRGRLREALEFIQDMPMKPDAGILGALLGACKIHRNLEIGEYAAHELFQLEPLAAAPYVEMANIYASAKEWGGVASMRMKMKSKQVMKPPGQSVVWLDGKCHLFTVEDRFHSEGFVVFDTLDNLGVQMKDEVDFLVTDKVLSLM